MKTVIACFVGFVFAIEAIVLGAFIVKNNPPRIEVSDNDAVGALLGTPLIVLGVGTVLGVIVYGCVKINEEVSSQ